MKHSEAATMEERIQAFFRQSGGPNNPDIEKILERHLLYGKDHGMKGQKETFQDAIRDALVDDKSTSMVLDWLAERRISQLQDKYQQQDVSQQLVDAIRSIGGDQTRLVALEKQVAALHDKLDRVLAQLESN